MSLPDDVRSALDTPVFVHLATVMPDGSPQVSAIWIGRRDDTLLFSTAEGRVKTENILRPSRARHTVRAGWSVADRPTRPQVHDSVGVSAARGPDPGQRRDHDRHRGGESLNAHHG